MRPVLVLLGAVAIFGLSHVLHVSHARREPTVTTTAAAAVVLGGATAQQRPALSGSHERDGGHALATPPAAVTAAHEFLMAYLPWQDGRASAAITSTLRRRSDPRLWVLLTSGPGAPRPPAGLSPTELESLVKGSVSSQRAATVLAILRRARRRSSLALVVRRRAGHWRVSDIGR